MAKFGTSNFKAQMFRSDHHFAINCDIFHFAETKVVFPLGVEHRQVVL